MHDPVGYAITERFHDLGTRCKMIDNVSIYAFRGVSSISGLWSAARLIQS